MRVAILDDIHDAYDGTAGVARLRERAEEVRIFTGPFGDPLTLRGFDALIANRERTKFTRELFGQLPDLRIIAQTGNHAYHVDFEAAEEHGVIVAKATGGFSFGTAELTIGLMIAVTRRIAEVDRQVKEGVWRTPTTPVLHAKTLGIVGLGRIGRQVARVASAMEMRVIAWGRSLTDEAAADAGVERRELDDVLREADVVSVHSTLSPESRGLVDGRRIGLMKPTAFLVNTSRGPIVEEAALVAALREGRIAGAALDVFDQEPLPPGHPLTTLDNVVLSPHVGWPTDEAYERFAEAAAEALLAYLDGREMPRFVAKP
jgi:phosphoglycerate dehydrogenase-like enzyme